MNLVGILDSALSCFSVRLIKSKAETEGKGSSLLENRKPKRARERGQMKRETTAESMGWKHELVALEGQESTEDGRKRLKRAAKTERRG